MRSRPRPHHIAQFVLLAALAAPSSVHAQGNTGPSGTAKQADKPNAHMNVTYYNQLGKYVDGWSGPTSWKGEPSGEYHGAVNGKSIEWYGEPPKRNSIRLETNYRGKGGESLKHVIPNDATTVVVVISPLGKATGTSKTPRANARKSLSPTKKPAKIRRYRPPRSVRRQRVPNESRQVRRRQTARTSTRSTITRRPRRTERSATIGDAPSVKNKRRSDKPASIGDGNDRRERARTAGVTGTGNLKGTEDGEFDGKPGGATAAQGGISAPNANARGKGTTTHGMKGGTGPNSAMGVPSGWGLIPLINVPASLRHLTDTLLIMQDANPGQLAANAMSKITAKKTVYKLRKNIARDASTYAKNRVAAHMDDINAATAKMTKQEREHALNRWRWEIQRQYFARVEKGAADKLQKGGLSAIDEHKAKMVLEATRVKPVAGQLPRSHRYAGKEFPREQLPAAYRQTGLRFTEDGFPDFGPYAYQLPNGQKSVQIRLTGSYDRDAARAKIAAGFKDSDVIPDHLTWHHHQDGKSLLLVPKKLHGAVRHTGGRGAYKHATGDPSVYP